MRLPSRWLTSQHIFSDFNELSYFGLPFGSSFMYFVGFTPVATTVY